MVTPETERRVALWMAFDRLGHAYLVRDDDAVRQELRLIERLRDEAAEAAIAAGARGDADVAGRTDLTQPVADPRAPQAAAPVWAAASGVLRRVMEQVAAAVDYLSTLPLAPAPVRSTEPSTTAQGDAQVDGQVRLILGTDVEVSAVANGVELGIDITGVHPSLEPRLRLFVVDDGEPVEAPLVSAGAGTGLLSATLSWSATLPRELVVVVLAVPLSPDNRPG